MNFLCYKNMFTYRVTLTRRSTAAPTNIPTPAPLKAPTYIDPKRLAPAVTITAPSKKVS